MKSNWKFDFCGCWHYLGFGGCFFQLNSLEKDNWKFDFCSFWQYLVLAVAFSTWNSNMKNNWKFDFCSFWQKSSQLCRIAFPRDAWKAHGHAGSALPEMIEKLTAMQDRLSQRWFKSSQPCRKGCTRNASQPCSPRDAWKAQSHPGNDWRVHSHAGQAVPNMLGKFTAMQDIVSQRCRKARSHARQAVPDMSQRCLTAMQDSLSQRRLESWQPCRIARPQRHRLMQDSLSQSSQAPYPAWLQAYPAWLWASHASLGSLSCMAVIFSNISGAGNPAWLSALQASLGKLSCMAVNFSSSSGTAYPAWLWDILHGCELQPILRAFQASLGQPILHGWDNRRIGQNCVYIIKI